MALIYSNVSPEDALRVIMKGESGGRNVPNQMGPGGTPLSTASGYYQMINSTWQEAARMAGLDTSQYPTAMSAPFEAQTAAARALYDRYGFTPWQGNPRTEADMATLNSGGTVTTPAPVASPGQPAPGANTGDVDLAGVFSNHLKQLQTQQAQLASQGQAPPINPMAFNLTPTVTALNQAANAFKGIS